VKLLVFEQYRWAVKGCITEPVLTKSNTFVSKSHLIVCKAMDKVDTNFDLDCNKIFRLMWYIKRKSEL